MFRWEAEADGRIYGVDGEDAYWIDEEEDGSIWVLTTGTEESFRRLFRLELSLAEVHGEIARLGPELAPHLAAAKGLRMMRCTSPTEVLFSFMCTGNNHLARIVPMVRALAHRGDVMREMEGRLVRRFPTVEQVASLSEEELREEGFGYRAKTIPSAARWVADQGGEDWLEGLRSMPYTEAFSALKQVPGMGAKLTDCVLLFGLGFNEAVPIDTHMVQALSRIYHPELAGKALTDARYRRLSGDFRSRFGLWSGWAHQVVFADSLASGRKSDHRR